MHVTAGNDGMRQEGERMMGKTRDHESRDFPVEFKQAFGNPILLFPRVTQSQPDKWQ